MSGGAVADVEVSDLQTEQMRRYGDAVNRERHIPSMCDGLKPVQRRILLTCLKGGLRSSNRFRKAARLVGGCMSDWHPHGDSSIYDAAVRMSRPWTMRVPLMEKHGNSGDRAGNSAAAQRYLELRAAPAAEHLWRDLEASGVPMVDGYDGSRKEPRHFPAAFPNILVNGSSGIGYGMSCDVPPHHPDSVADAVELLIGNPDASEREVADVLGGPDFPSGGVVVDRDGLAAAYAAGSGSTTVASRVVVGEAPRGGWTLEIVEIPWNATTTRIMEGIAALPKELGIVGLADMSAGEDARIVLTLDRKASPAKAEAALLASTDAAQTFRINMVLLDADGNPRRHTLKGLLSDWIAFRRGCVRRTLQSRCVELRAKLDQAAGQARALSDFDRATGVLRAAADADSAVEELVEGLGFPRSQARALVSSRMSALTASEFDSATRREADLRKEMDGVLAVLSDPALVDAELIRAMREAVAPGGPRRTELTNRGRPSLDAPADMVVFVTEGNRMGRADADGLRLQRRGGKGGKSPGGGDPVRREFLCSAGDALLAVTSRGRAHALSAGDVPITRKGKRGLPLDTFVDGLAEGESVLDAFQAASDLPDLMLLTRRGMGKRISMPALIRRGGVCAMAVAEDDFVASAFPCAEGDGALLLLDGGRIALVPAREFRLLSRAAAGSMACARGAVLLDARRAPASAERGIAVSADGRAKRFPLDSIRVSRGSVGRVCYDRPKRNLGPRPEPVFLAAEPDAEGAELALCTSGGGSIRFPLSEVPVLERTAWGVKAMGLAEGDRVCGAAVFVP